MTHAASFDNAKVMNRFALTQRLVGKLAREEAVVGGIGNTNFDLWAAGQRPQNFYLLGSMGLAIPIALGVETHTCTRLDELEFIVDRGVKQAVATQAPVCFILSPLLTGGKVFEG